ncbi:hypothetical protein QQX09_10225 [Demequina sp. SYSU T00192]|uniref:ATP-binding protein n=1 Tax=Demequina litoralis TaxID=3051660 RepID=A0ABT8GAR3_9MICO|nr:hypothetical protein [Demequina sp. SYSU T00192]MDN4476230.1 hypothetical protein [Demequina sp. SYSU T00192]
MPESLLRNRVVENAVSNIVPRSERQADPSLLRSTYVDAGVLAQMSNAKNQILYGRRGTGKSHLLQYLATELAKGGTTATAYVDLRLLGSSHLYLDQNRPIADRCVAVFRDLLGIIQSTLMDYATDPKSDGSGIEAVSAFADFIVSRAATVRERAVTKSVRTSHETNGRLSAETGTAGLKFGADLNSQENTQTSQAESYTEILNDTLVFSEVHSYLTRALAALGIDNLTILLDEWNSLPLDLQPHIAHFLNRSIFPSSAVTVKIASLEYRSRFAIAQEGANAIGFELGADVAANIDLDDYYVYERNPEQVGALFEEVLFKHVAYGEAAVELSAIGIRDAKALRARLFTEQATFLELVRAGEGVARDFLGIFDSAFFKSRNGQREKIELRSVEDAARDWYESDKSAELSPQQHAALHQIITDVIGARQTKMFMLRRENASHPMIQSLFDRRVIHLISRGYSDKENPGQRYNIYALDYGTYVDLKRTKAEPAGTLFEVEQVEEEPRVVPFADKRSIRRVILDPAIFDASSTAS